MTAVTISGFIFEWRDILSNVFTYINLIKDINAEDYVLLIFSFPLDVLNTSLSLIRVSSVMVMCKNMALCGVLMKGSVALCAPSYLGVILVSTF